MSEPFLDFVEINLKLFGINGRPYEKSNFGCKSPLKLALLNSTIPRVEYSGFRGACRLQCRISLPSLSCSLCRSRLSTVNILSGLVRLESGANASALTSIIGQAGPGGLQEAGGLTGTIVMGSRLFRDAIPVDSGWETGNHSQGSNQYSELGITACGFLSSKHASNNYVLNSDRE
jgi:hypothetical protein